jgi:hypothetical protein
MTKAVISVSTEPDSTIIDISQENYKIELTKSLNWYNLEKERKDAKKYLIQFASKDGKESIVSDIPDAEIIPTYGWLARISMRGGTLSKIDNDRLSSYIDSLSKKSFKKPIAQLTQRASIQEATSNKINEYLGDLEVIIDELYKGKIKTFDLLSDLKARQLPKQCNTQIEAWVKEKISEFVNVYETKDEAYTIERKTLVALIKALGTFMPAVQAYCDFKKANRKPRKRKVKPAAVQIKNLKYKKSDDELKINSVTVTTIVGAMQVWVYNTKTRKLAVYRTESASGIQVKGSTLQNYEPELSCQKTLRKPETQLQELLSAGKIQMRKFMDNIKAKAQPVRGRINADTLIIKVG